MQLSATFDIDAAVDEHKRVELQYYYEWYICIYIYDVYDSVGDNG